MCQVFFNIFAANFKTQSYTFEIMEWITLTLGSNKFTHLRSKELNMYDGLTKIKLIKNEK